MDEKTAHLADQLKNNPAMLNTLMQSKDGRMLMQMLTQGDRGAALQQAIQSAVRGNTTQMTDMVQRIMQSPEGSALIKRIQKTLQT